MEEAGILEQGTEVVFWGADSGTVTIRDNVGILSGGQTGTVEPDTGGGLDLTITEQFARSMSLREALNRDNLLCYEMNGEPLPPENGFPVRLIAPGWYGVANVKWLTRIEVMDRRYAGHFMARDYVTIREEQRDGETVWTFTTVSHDRLKSAPAKVTRRDEPVHHHGRRLGRADRGGGGPNRRWTLDGGAARWSTRHAGKCRVATPGGSGRSTGGRPPRASTRSRSRAFDVDGNIQPAPDDPFLASKRTYWESNGHITRRVLIP